MNTPEYLMTESALLAGTVVAVGVLTVRLFAKEHARNSQFSVDYDKSDYGFRNSEVINEVKRNNGSIVGWEFYMTENGEGIRRVTQAKPETQAEADDQFRQAG